MGSRDIVHGPKLVNRPAVNIKNIVIGPGLFTPSCMSKFPFWASSEIIRLNEEILLNYYF